MLARRYLKPKEAWIYLAFNVVRMISGMTEFGIT
jgi:hypothetical protein